MEHLKQYTLNIDTPTLQTRSERDYWMNQIIEKINAERAAENKKAGRVVWKPVSGRGIAIRLNEQKYSTTDLHFLIKKCEQYSGGFSKAFFGITKTQKK